MSVLAVVAVRNESGYIATTLRTLIDEGIEVVLIDNGSVDGTRELAEPFIGGGLLAIHELPWTGEYRWEEILEAKQQVFRSSLHEWRMHVDADEWLRSIHDAPLGEFLAHGVDRRFQVVNFREFVFLPPDGVDMWGRDWRRIARSYYLFEPRPQRLMRAWRREVAGDNVATGGHRLSGVDADAILPENQVLRHSIGLSWSQAISRRADRTYGAADLARGWHGNRRDLRAARPVTGHRAVLTVDPWDTRRLDDSRPMAFHFWERGFHSLTGPAKPDRRWCR